MAAKTTKRNRGGAPITLRVDCAVGVNWKSFKSGPISLIHCSNLAALHFPLRFSRPRICLLDGRDLRLGHHRAAVYIGRQVRTNYLARSWRRHAQLPRFAVQSIQIA